MKVGSDEMNCNNFGDALTLKHHHQVQICPALRFVTQHLQNYISISFSCNTFSAN